MVSLIFLRLLGAVYLIAFASLWSQLSGLYGARGILPIADFTRQYATLTRRQKLRYFPSVFWLGASDRALHAACAVGTVCACLVIFGVATVPALAVLYVLYLSFTSVGQDFLSFQWDSLLLETGFIAVVFGPGSCLGFFMLRWLLFRLLFESGAVKLSCGDTTWWRLTALDYHYFTQPLPTPPAWYFHHMAAWFRKASVFVTLAIELVIPFLIWGPKPLPQIACFLFLSLMALIALTGNYTFFNFLTAALALLLLDDSARAPLTLDPRLVPAAILILVSVPQLVRSAFPALRPPKRLRLRAVESALQPFRVVNSFGLFRVMTTMRPEITVEGSLDGKEWREYRFRWKAGDPRRRPRFVEPHQPRLDWQMWFAALGEFRSETWFQNFLVRLVEGSPAVLKLLVENPFPRESPRYIRAMLSKYEFTTPAERKETGAWWRVTPLGHYSPMLCADEPD